MLDVGFKVISEFERVNQAMIDGFEGISASTIAEVIESKRNS